MTRNKYQLVLTRRKKMKRMMMSYCCWNYWSLRMMMMSYYYLNYWSLKRMMTSYYY